MYPDCPSLSGLGKRHEAADKTHKHHVTGNDSSCPPVPCDHRVVIPSSRCVCVSSRCLQSRSAFLFSFRVSSFLNDVDKLEGSHKMEYELNLITVFWYLALSSFGNIVQHFFWGSVLLCFPAGFPRFYDINSFRKGISTRLRNLI